MSDGGDGFGEVLSVHLEARPQTVKTVDAAHRPIKATWWYEPRSKTAIIDSSRIIGLAQLPPKKFHPFELDTYGLGAVLTAAANKGARRCMMGIGGSATNDGGFGMARALGWQFHDKAGKCIEKWTDLPKLERIYRPQHPRWFEEFVVAVDVQNPLLGAKGATKIYGLQKGLTTKDFVPAEACLRRLAAIVEREMDRNYGADDGMGAAGGLGFGLRAFAGGRLEPGFGVFARLSELRRHMGIAQMIVTAEGRIDQSSLMGKGVGEVAWWSRKLNLPCIGFAGVIGDAAAVKKLFTSAHALTPKFTTLAKAMKQPETSLAALAKKVASELEAR